MSIGGFNLPGFNVNDDNDNIDTGQTGRMGVDDDSVDNSPDPDPTTGSISKLRKRHLKWKQKSLRRKNKQSSRNLSNTTSVSASSASSTVTPQPSTPIRGFDTIDSRSGNGNINVNGNIEKPEYSRTGTQSHSFDWEKHDANKSLTEMSSQLVKQNCARQKSLSLGISDIHNHPFRNNNESDSDESGHYNFDDHRDGNDITPTVTHVSSSSHSSITSDMISDDIMKSLNSLETKSKKSRKSVNIESLQEIDETILNSKHNKKLKEAENSEVQDSWFNSIANTITNKTITNNNNNNNGKRSSDLLGVPKRSSSKRQQLQQLQQQQNMINKTHLKHPQDSKNFSGESIIDVNFDIPDNEDELDIDLQDMFFFEMERRKSLSKTMSFEPSNNNFNNFNNFNMMTPHKNQNSFSANMGFTNHSNDGSNEYQYNNDSNNNSNNQLQQRPTSPFQWDMGWDHMKQLSETLSIEDYNTAEIAKLTKNEKHRLKTRKNKNQKNDLDLSVVNEEDEPSTDHEIIMGAVGASGGSGSGSNDTVKIHHHTDGGLTSDGGSIIIQTTDDEQDEYHQRNKNNKNKQRKFRHQDNKFDEDYSQTPSRSNSRSPTQSPSQSNSRSNARRVSNPRYENEFPDLINPSRSISRRNSRTQTGSVIDYSDEEEEEEDDDDDDDDDESGDEDGSVLESVKHRSRRASKHHQSKHSVNNLEYDNSLYLSNVVFSNKKQQHQKQQLHDRNVSLTQESSNTPVPSSVSLRISPPMNDNGIAFSHINVSNNINHLGPQLNNKQSKHVPTWSQYQELEFPEDFQGTIAATQEAEEAVGITNIQLNINPNNNNNLPGLPRATSTSSSTFSSGTGYVITKFPDRSPGTTPTPDGTKSKFSFENAASINLNPNKNRNDKLHQSSINSDGTNNSSSGTSLSKPNSVVIHHNKSPLAIETPSAINDHGGAYSHSPSFKNENNKNTKSTHRDSYLGFDFGDDIAEFNSNDNSNNNNINNEDIHFDQHNNINNEDIHFDQHNNDNMVFMDDENDNDIMDDQDLLEYQSRIPKIHISSHNTNLSNVNTNNNSNNSSNINSSSNSNYSSNISSPHKSPMMNTLSPHFVPNRGHHAYSSSIDSVASLDLGEFDPFGNNRNDFEPSRGSMVFGNSRGGANLLDFVEKQSENPLKLFNQPSDKTKMVEETLIQEL